MATSPTTDQLEQLMSALVTLAMGAATSPAITQAMGAWPDAAFFQEDRNLPAMFFLVAGARPLTSRQRWYPFAVVPNGDGTVTKYFEVAKIGYMIDLHAVANTREDAVNIAKAVADAIDEQQDIPLPGGVGNSLATFMGDALPYTDQSLNVYHRVLTYQFQLRRLMAVTSPIVQAIQLNTTIQGG